MIIGSESEVVVLAILETEVGKVLNPKNHGLQLSIAFKCYFL
jgi:hypothetical protein